MNKKSQKEKTNKKKISDKTIMLIAAAISLVFLVIIVSLIFKDSLFKPRPEKVNWGEVSEEGSISGDFDDVEKEDKYYVDEKGLEYQKYNFYNLGYSMFIPSEWDVEMINPDTFYIRSNNETYKTMEIGIFLREMQMVTPDNLQPNMLNFMRYSFEYHYRNYVFQDSNFSYGVDTADYLYDENKTVYVETSNPLSYAEFDEPEGPGSWEKKNKFIGIHERGTFSNMTTSMGDTYVEPTFDLFYTFNKNNKELLVSMTRTENYSSLASYTFNEIIKSIEPLEPTDEVFLPVFNKYYKVGSMNFKYPDHFKNVFSNKEGFMAFANDPNYNDCGITLSVNMLPFSKDSELSIDMANNPTYKYILMNNYTKTDSSSMPTMSDLNNIILGFDIGEESILQDKTVTKFNTILRMKDTSSLDYVKINRAFPIKAFTYLIQDKDSSTVYILNITYGESNKEIAEKYARAFLKTVHF